jgi:hypothetical protein
MRSMKTIVILLLLLSVSAGGAMAFKNCQTVLGNNHYSCSGITEFHGPFTTCLKVTSPGTGFEKFDIFLTEIATRLSCACRAKGSATHPNFNASTEFKCLGVSPAGFSYAIEGKAANKAIKNGFGLTQASRQATVFECSLSNCSPSGAFL